MKRYLLNQADQSNKFWHLETDGERLHVHYGRVGTQGQRQTKAFADAARCEQEAQKLANEKLRKGYADYAPDAPVPEKAAVLNPIAQRLAYYVQLGLQTQAQILERIDLDVFEGDLSEHDDSGEFDPVDFFDRRFDGDSERFGRWLAQQLAAQLAQQRQREASFPAPTDFERLARAFAALRTQGFVALHLATDTWSGGLEMAGSRAHDQPGANAYCFYHEQAVRDLTAPFDLHLYFGILNGPFPADETATQAAGQRVLAALAAEGLRPAWGGAADQSIQLPQFVWQKRFDGADWVRAEPPLPALAAGAAAPSMVPAVVPAAAAAATAPSGPRLRGELLAGKRVRLLPEFKKSVLGSRAVQQQLLEAHGATVLPPSARHEPCDFYLGTTTFTAPYAGWWASAPTVFEEDLLLEPVVVPSAAFAGLRAQLRALFGYLLFHPNIVVTDFSLGTPLTEADLVRFEKKLGRPLPGLLRAFYQQVGELRLLWAYRISHKTLALVTSGWNRDLHDNHEGNIQLLPLREVLFGDWFGKKVNYYFALAPTQRILDYYTEYHMMALELAGSDDDPLLYLGNDHGVRFDEHLPIRFSDYLSLALATGGWRGRTAHFAQTSYGRSADDRPPVLAGLAQQPPPHPYAYDFVSREPEQPDAVNGDAYNALLAHYAHAGLEGHFFGLLEQVVTHNGISLAAYEAARLSYNPYFDTPRYAALRARLGLTAPAPTGATPPQAVLTQFESPFRFADSALKGAFEIRNTRGTDLHILGYTLDFVTWAGPQRLVLQTDDSDQHAARFQPVTDGTFLFLTQKHGVCIEKLDLCAFPLVVPPGAARTVPFYLYDLDLAATLAPHGIHDATSARKRDGRAFLSLEVRQPDGAVLDDSKSVKLK